MRKYAMGGGGGGRCRSANGIPGLVFWLPPNIPEKESDLMNLEEPLKLLFRAEHSSASLHHPPPFRKKSKHKTWIGYQDRIFITTKSVFKLLLSLTFCTIFDHSFYSKH
jgi:hypothetical protein